MKRSPLILTALLFSRPLLFAQSEVLDSRYEDSLKNYIEIVNRYFLKDSASFTGDVLWDKARFLCSGKDSLIYKAEISFLSKPKKRIVYYQYDSETYSPCENVCYVREYDTLTNVTETELLRWNNKWLRSSLDSIPVNFFKDEETRKKHIQTREKRQFLRKSQGYLCENDFMSVYRHRLAVKEKCFMKGRLVAGVPKEEIIDCGFAFVALALKFKVIETDHPDESDYFIIIIQCPNSSPRAFREGEIYDITFMPHAESPFELEAYSEGFDKNLPVFWAEGKDMK